MPGSASTAEERPKELQLAQTEGKLLDAGEVRSSLAGMGTHARDKLLPIGDEIADKLAAETDRVRCRAIVDDRIRQALTALSEFKA